MVHFQKSVTKCVEELALQNSCVVHASLSLFGSLSLPALLTFSLPLLAYELPHYTPSRGFKKAGLEVLAAIHPSLCLCVLVLVCCSESRLCQSLQHPGCSAQRCRVHIAGPPIFSSFWVLFCWLWAISRWKAKVRRRVMLPVVGILVSLCGHRDGQANSSR